MLLTGSTYRKFIFSNFVDGVINPISPPLSGSRVWIYFVCFPGDVPSVIVGSTKSWAWWSSSLNYRSYWEELRSLDEPGTADPFVSQIHRDNDPWSVSTNSVLVGFTKLINMCYLCRSGFSLTRSNITEKNVQSGVSPNSPTPLWKKNCFSI